MEKNLRFSFDRKADILDISVGVPQKAISREIDDDFFVRVDPKTKKVIGFSILNFGKWFQHRDKKVVPVQAEFLLAN